MITLLKFKFFNHRSFEISDYKFCQMIELKDPGCKEIGMFKGTERVTLSDPPMKDCNAKFPTVP